MNMWDHRYATAEHVYGTAPNAWLAEQGARLPPACRILSLGEGEGRNAVWLAQQGHQVEAVDGSSVGLEKARRLAGARGVSIATTVADLAHYQPAAGAYQAVVLIFLHLPPALRAAVHAKAEAALAPGGRLILEAYTPRQLGHDSGGPKEASMLYEPATVRADFPGIEWEVLREEALELDEGPLHRGLAAVVRGAGRRAEGASPTRASMG